VRQFAKPLEGPLADYPVEAEVAPPELLARGFRPFNRFRYELSRRHDTAQTADLLCSGNSVAVLPLDPARGEIILLRQFRLAAHLANGRGGLFEIAAGHVEKDENPAETARRECAEEIGCAPEPLIELFTYLTTPGLCDEQITLFLGIIDVTQIPERAGLAAEREETFLVRVPVDRALEAVAAGGLRSGPLLMALNWLALNRSRLDDIVRAGPERT
jgi:ADP-ribose pyrophosphatase